MLTELGVEQPLHSRERYPAVKAVAYDGALFPFAESRRVARSSFITTPNRWFPIETHTRTPLVHWLPKKRFDAYLRRRGQDWAAGDYMQLLSVQDLRRVLRMAGIPEYRIVANRIGPMALDFVVMFGERSRFS
jgi:hypothetical protein